MKNNQYRPVIEITDTQKKLLKSMSKQRNIDEKILLGQLVSSALLRECMHASTSQ